MLFDELLLMNEKGGKGQELKIPLSLSCRFTPLLSFFFFNYQYLQVFASKFFSSGQHVFSILCARIIHFLFHYIYLLVQQFATNVDISRL